MTTQTSCASIVNTYRDPTAPIIATPMSGGCIQFVSDLVEVYSDPCNNTTYEQIVSGGWSEIDCSAQKVSPQPPAPNIPPPVPEKINELVSKTTSCRQPASSELSNIHYDPTANVYYATWKPAAPLCKTTYNYSLTPPETDFNPYDSSAVYQVSSSALTGPWAIIGNINEPSSPFSTAGIAVDSSGNIFVGTSVGVFKSTDSGASFKFIGGPPNIQQIVASSTQLFVVTYNPSLVGSEYAPVYIYTSLDGGSNWVQIYSKYGNQAGINVTTPLVAVLGGTPVIIDNEIVSITGASVATSGQPLDILNVYQQYSGFFTGLDSVQPLYVGEDYIAIENFSQGSSYYNFYTLAVNGSTTYIGTIALSYPPVYSGGITAEMLLQPGMSFGRAVTLSNGSTISVNVIFPYDTPGIQGGNATAPQSAVTQ